MWFSTLLGLLALLAAFVPWQPLVVESVVPISGYQQNTLFNGKNTVRNTVIITCTESDPIGTLLVGNYTVNVTCVPPAYNYRFTAVGAVPKATQLRVEKACLIKDSSQYDSSQQLASAATNPQAQDDSSLTSPASRRLLFLPLLAAAAPVLGVGAALGLGVDGFVEARRANERLDKVQQSLDEAKATVGKLGETSDKLQAGLNATNLALSALSDGMKVTNDTLHILQGEADQLNLKFSNLSANVNNFINATDKQFTALNAAMAHNADVINANADQSFNYTNTQFKLVYDQMLSLNNVLQQEIKTLTRGQMYQTENLQNAIITMTRLLRQASLHRLIIQSFYGSLDSLDQRLKPFTLGLGIRPANQLFGSDKRVLLDRLDINWVTNNTANRYSIYATQVRIYIDSVWGMDNLKFFASVEQMTNLFGDETCARSYGDSDTPQDSSNIQCRVWAEVRTSVCLSSQLSPKFSWLGVNTTTLKQTFCTDPIQTLSVGVFRSFDNLVTNFQQDICTTPGTQVNVASFRSGKRFTLPSNGLCSKSWRDQIYYSQVLSGQQGYPLLYSVLSIFAQSYTVVFADLYDRELKIYGRNPGGFKYEKRDNDYVPSQYNGTTPIYDGGAEPVDCTYATWLAVHRQALNMYSITPLASPTVRKSVLIGVSGPQCNDPTTCYPVGERDVTANIQLNNDASATLPGDFLMLGELKDMRQGIWDVPARSLSASSATSERANTPSYILMPPDTTDTYELADWIGRNTDLFDPALGAVSPELYRYDTKFDVENYPYCDLQADALVRAPNQTTNGCIRPFTYNTTITSDATSVDSATSTTLPSQCTTFTYTQLYKSYRSEITTATISTAANSAVANAVSTGTSYTFSFWYRQTSVLGDNGAVTLLAVLSNVLSSFVRFGVNANGTPFVTHGATTSSSLASGIDLRDGLWHYVAWSISASGGTTTYRLTIDRTYYGQFALAASSFQSSAPFVQRLDQLTPQSLSAEASLIRVIIGSTLSQTNLALQQQCQLSILPIDRCFTTGTQIVLARQDVTSSDTMSCISGSQLLLSDFYFDSLFPLPAPTASTWMQGSFSATFWLRGGDRSSTNVRLVEISGGSNQLIVQYVSGNIVSLQINGKATTITAYNGQSHFFSITFDGQNANIYYDGDFYTGVDATSTATYSTVRTFSNAAVFQFKYYAQSVLSSDQVMHEGMCQFASTMNATSSVAPIGSCYMLQPAGNTGFGYCRHGMSCGGHCTSYAFINKVSGTYSVLDNGCDAGFSRPTCTAACSRIDPVSGQCLTSITTKATGLTPGSTLCTTLNNYKLAVNPSNKLLTFTPRVWQYTVSIGVPSGTVVNVVNTGACPKTTIFPNIDGSYSVVMENDQADPSVVIVLYAPDAVFLEGAACESPCCQLATDQLRTISGRSGITVNVPSAGCGNQTIIIQQPQSVTDTALNGTVTTTGECSRFTSDQLVTLVATAFNQPVATAVASRITLALDSASEGIRDVTTAIGKSMVDLMALGASVGFNSDLFRQVITEQRALLDEAKFNPLNLTTSLPVFNVSGIMDSIAAGSAELSAYFNASSFALSANQRKFNDLNAAADGAIADLGRTVNESAKLLEEFWALHAAWNTDISADSGVDLTGFGNFLKAVANEVGDIVLDTAHAGRNFLDDALDLIGIPGSLLGGFGNFLGTLLKIAFYVVILYGCFIGGKFLYAQYQARQAAQKTANKYKELKDEVLTAVTTSTPAPQPTTAAKQSSTASRLVNATRRMQRYARYTDDDD